MSDSPPSSRKGSLGDAAAYTRAAGFRALGVVVEEPRAPGLAPVYRLPRPRRPQPEGPTAA